MAIARAMLQTGDWVTPRLYGQPWFEKPVLYYWAAAAAFRLFGVNEFAARLPSALAALLATAAMAWAALRSYGLDAAWLTLLMLPTTLAALGFARAASPDMLFSALLVAAAVSAAEMLEKKRPGQLARLTFGVFLGAATLAKGPAAVLLAGGAALLWALASGQWRAVFRLTHPMCVTAFLVVAAPWYALCAWRNPEFLRVFIIEHNFSRYFTPVFQHVQPFWFFGPIILAATIPWTLLLLPLAIAAMARVRANAQWKDSPALFFGSWAIFPVLFFSFSESKLPGYVLPAVPPLILLLATISAPWLKTPSPKQRTAVARCWLALVGCTFSGLALAGASWFRRPASRIDLDRLQGARRPDGDGDRWGTRLHVPRARGTPQACIRDGGRAHGGTSCGRQHRDHPESGSVAFAAHGSPSHAARSVRRLEAGDPACQPAVGIRLGLLPG